jgi:hypothetical protein
MNYKLQLNRTEQQRSFSASSITASGVGGGYAENDSVVCSSYYEREATRII